MSLFREHFFPFYHPDTFRYARFYSFSHKYGNASIYIGMHGYMLPWRIKTRCATAVLPMALMSFQQHQC